METFLECENVSRAITWTRVRGKCGRNRSKKSGRSSASYTVTRDKKTTPLRPIFSRSLWNS